MQSTRAKHVTEWDEGDVHQWFTNLGYPQYEHVLREHKIQGDALCMMDPSGLQTLGVSSAGQRLAILKAIYNLKVEQDIPLEDDSYIPPSESNNIEHRPPIEELNDRVKDQGRRLLTLEEENKALATAMSTFAKEIEKLRSLLKANIEPRLARSSSTPEAPRSHTATPERSRTPVSDLTSTAILTPSSSASDMGYGPKVSLNDPTWKVLPAALKKHGNMDDPKEYVMFISYDSPGSIRTKRRLGLEEKPLYLFKKLKEAKKNPAFLLRKIKDARYQYGADFTNGTITPDTSWTPVDAGIANHLTTPPLSTIRDPTPEPPNLSG